MGEALGMIETKGLVAMIEAADAMVKAAMSPMSRARSTRYATPKRSRPNCSSPIWKASSDATIRPSNGRAAATARRRTMSR